MIIKFPLSRLNELKTTLEVSDYYKECLYIMLQAIAYHFSGIHDAILGIIKLQNTHKSPSTLERTLVSKVKLFTASKQ